MQRIEYRMKILDEIKHFVEDTEKEIKVILENLGWSEERLMQGDPTRIRCPIDPSHLVGPAKMKEHVERCKLGPHEFDEPFPENAYRSSGTSTVTIDSQLGAEIIAQAARFDPTFRGNQSQEIRNMPSTHNQMVANFTPDERRALYDYVINRTKSEDQIESEDHGFLLTLNEPQNTSQRKSAVEELAMIRDMKRRRAKYKVSTKSKSHTEVLRGVIDNLMASYEEDIKANSEYRKQKSEQKRTEQTSRSKSSKYDGYDSRKHSSHKL